MLSGSKYMLECIVGVGFGKCLPKFRKPKVTCLIFSTFSVRDQKIIKIYPKNSARLMITILYH